MKRITNFWTMHPRNFLIVALVISFVVSAIYGFVEYRAANNHDKNNTPAGQRSITGTPAEQSAQKAQYYLIDSITLVRPIERLFLDYLQRKFELDKRLGTNGPPFDLSEDPRTYPEEIHYLARIGYPDRLVKIPPGDRFDDPASITNVYSSNCDHLQLTDNYWQAVKQSIDRGGYYITHVSLALAFMKDNNCALSAEMTQIEDIVIEGMKKLADDPSTAADLRYEAIAFLLHSDHDELVQDKWIDQIIAEQNKDGGWSLEAGDNKSDSHSTVLAVWALLEYTQQNRPNEPIIRSPNL